MIRQQKLRCLRNQMDFGLILLDVDHFKFYNDHYGHAQGDDCLKSVRKCHEMTVCYGGEEFVYSYPLLRR